jgi:hypothetical protein
MGSTIAGIFGSHFHQYAAGKSLPSQQYKVANAIMTCRTEALGGHIYRCDECGHTVITYNSCRNRHCHSVLLHRVFQSRPERRNCT